MTQSKPTKSRASKQKYFEAVGRRKSAIARVRMFIGKTTKKAVKDNATKKPGSEAQVIINEKPVETYFSIEKLQHLVQEPIKKLKSSTAIKVTVKVTGGGMNGQAEAIRLGISRAIKGYDPDLLPELRSAGLLTRDPRMKERKKPGLRGARRSQQWSKR